MMYLHLISCTELFTQMLTWNFFRIYNSPYSMASGCSSSGQPAGQDIIIE